MTDKTGDDDGKGGWTPRERKAETPGDKRVYKPRLLADGSARPAGPWHPTGDAPARKSYPKSFDTDAPGMSRSASDKRATGGRPRPFSGDKPSRPLAASPARPAARAETASEPAGTMRIAKRLARAGVASRRDAEGMIADGRVKLNGKILDTPAVVVTASDRIEIDNAPLPQIERTRLWLFHKPAGLVTTNRDPEGRPTVFDKLPEDLPRVLSVGRLDINTEGLLLLTNDGGLARILELPATGWLRRYRVRAFGSVTQAQLDELRQGVAIDGVFYGAIEASLDSQKGDNVWLTIGLREGKNREVKRILGHLGLEVNRLIRISFGPFQLGDLPDGAVREIKGRMLRDQLGERLIEEAGADFDAPIVNTFTNETVKAEKKADEEKARDDKAKAKSEWVSATTERPNKRKFGDAKRVSALGRLDTQPDRPDRDRPDRSRPGVGRPDRERSGAERPQGDWSARPRPERAGPRPDRPDRPPRDRDAREGDDAAAPGASPAAAKRPGGIRRANVWMAPGARPIGEKAASEREERSQRRDRPKPVFGKAAGGRDDAGERPKRPSTPSRVGDRSSARPVGDAPRGRPRPPSGGKPGAGGPGRAGPGGSGNGARPPSGGGPKRGPRS